MQDDGYDVDDVDAAVSGDAATDDTPGEWQDALGGDADMHAEMLGEDTAFLTILPLGGPFPPIE